MRTLVFILMSVAVLYGVDPSSCVNRPYDKAIAEKICKTTINDYKPSTPLPKECVSIWK